jgi:hypothetical protein
MRVKRWEEVPNQELIDTHRVLYDSPDPEFRQEVDLFELPHRDPETHRENNVYDDSGRRIPRLHGRLSRTAKPCGLLINLETISELFSSCIPDHADMEVDADDAFGTEHHVLPSVNVYPQAFLRKYGHVQCNTVLPHFDPFILDIRRSTSRRPRVAATSDNDEPLHEEDDLFGDDHNDDDPIPPVLIPSTCQFYNEISHRIRPSAALHDVQQGRITSALSGAYANGPAKRSHSALVRECKMGLPHQKYNNKISLDDVPRALRLENIYIVQCDSLKPEKRNGLSVFFPYFSRSFACFADSRFIFLIFRSIYKDIVVPLSRAWSHPNVFQALRPHLFIFAPQVSFFYLLFAPQFSY